MTVCVCVHAHAQVSTSGDGCVCVCLGWLCVFVYVSMRICMPCVAVRRGCVVCVCLLVVVECLLYQSMVALYRCLGCICA